MTSLFWGYYFRCTNFRSTGVFTLSIHFYVEAEHHCCRKAASDRRNNNLFTKITGDIFFPYLSLAIPLAFSIVGTILYIKNHGSSRIGVRFRYASACLTATVTFLLVIRSITNFGRNHACTSRWYSPGPWTTKLICNYSTRELSRSGAMR
jgi:hypothetical protein